MKIKQVEYELNFLITPAPAGFDTVSRDDIVLRVFSRGAPRKTGKIFNHALPKLQFKICQASFIRGQVTENHENTDKDRARSVSLSDM